MDELLITVRVQVEQLESAQVQATRTVAADGRRKPNGCNRRPSIHLRELPVASLLENTRLVFVYCRHKRRKSTSAREMQEQGVNQLELPLNYE